MTTAPGIAVAEPSVLVTVKSADRGSELSRTDTSPEVKLGMARSGLPSALKSPTPTPIAFRPVVGKVVVPTVWRAPAPSPVRMVTVFAVKLDTATSALPSRLKSPIPRPKGSVPGAVVGLGQEGAIADSEQHGDAGGEAIRDHHVGERVGVQVADDDGAGTVPGGDRDRGAEHARDVQENGDAAAGAAAAGAEVGDDHVEQAVARSVAPGRCPEG